MGPDSVVGQAPVRRRCACAQARTCRRVSGGGRLGMRTPRRSTRSRVRDEPPGKPRRPIWKSGTDGRPRFPGAVGDGAGRGRGPGPRASAVGVGPGEDLFTGEPGQALEVALAASQGQQPGEGRPARQAAHADAQGVVHGPPGFSRRIGDGAGQGRGPGPRAPAVGVGPGENALPAQRGQSAQVADGAVFGQQSGQRRAAVQAAQPQTQGVIDAAPGFAEQIGERPGAADRPRAVRRKKASAQART